MWHNHTYNKLESNKMALFSTGDKIIAYSLVVCCLKLVSNNAAVTITTTTTTYMDRPTTLFRIEGGRNKWGEVGKGKKS